MQPSSSSSSSHSPRRGRTATSAASTATSASTTSASATSNDETNMTEEGFYNAGTSSPWESYDEQPQSRFSSRVEDRRKRFDTTTPTLIDEEDEEEELDFGGLPHPSSQEDFAHNQNTPSSTPSMRRTPGAIQMHQSTVLQLVGLPHSHSQSHPTRPSSSGLWESESSVVGNESSPFEDITRPALTRQSVARDAVTAAVTATSTTATSAAHAATTGSNTNTATTDASATAATRSFLSPWKQPTPNSPDSSNRHGAFSPNLFRLTEDIGILLKEDEDDDVCLEIPAVIRGEDSEQSGTSQIHAEGGWAGSYIFDTSTQPKLSRRTVARPSTMTKEKARRRSHQLQQQQQQQQQQHSYFFPHAQHPKPRRQEGALFFEGDERASPQLLTFSPGAFMPPTSFMHRPVASTPASSSYSTAFEGQHQQHFHQHPQTVPPMGGPTFPTGFSFQPTAFQSLQHPPRFTATPSPTLSHGSSVASSVQHSSKMQATAQVFVPRSSTPQFASPPSHWVVHEQQQPPPLLQQQQPRDWHTSPSFSYGPTYSTYGTGSAANTNILPASQPPPPGMPTFETRAALTPSPLWPDSMLYSAPSSTSGTFSSMTTTVLAASAASSASAPAATAPKSTPTLSTSTRMGTTTPTPSDPSPSPYPSIDGFTVGRTANTPTSLTQEADKPKKEARNRKRGQKKKTKPTPIASAPSPAFSKKTTKISSVSSTTSDQPDAEDVAAASGSEDPDTKRGELDETPATRLAFKNFYKAFRTEERFSFDKAKELALHALQDGSLPDSIHYKVYLELADLAKRSNQYSEARRLYQKVCQLQPYASQGWLEYSKLEEECGCMNRVTNILHAGLEYCTYSESLLTRAVKHQERAGNLGSAREILARLKHVGIEKVWRTVLEGALLEARAGNSDMARRVLKYLMHHVPWYGPLYLEAYKLERDQGHQDDALQVVQRGLEALPRYGPLWFGAFRLYEEMDIVEKRFNLPKTMKMIERAKLSVSKELVWKVHLEAAQMLERAAFLHLGYTGDNALLDSFLRPARERLVLTVLTCPNNLRWKVWLAAGRMELIVGSFETARALFRRAHFVVQHKSRSSTLLDCARLEEFVGDTALARAVLCKARVEHGSDWKVWLESVLLEIRSCRYGRALEIAERALDIHTGTGRLWATLVQLQHLVGDDMAQKRALDRALLSVPKSGEVWCEGGRIRLNPFSTTFDLERARRCLYFAAKFTPQFGDSFVESLRVEILSQWLVPIAKYIWKRTKKSFLGPSGSGNLTKYIFDVSLAITIARNHAGDDSRNLPPTQYRDIVTRVRKKLRFESLRASIDLTDIRLACANADPNYGALWFLCRKSPTDTPRRVIENAADLVADDLFRHAHIYLAAMVRRLAVITTVDIQRPRYEGIETNDPSVIAWETTIDTTLRDATSLADMLNPVDPTTGLVFLESTSRGSTFVAGLVELSRPRFVKDMTLYERRRAVFGTDALLP